MKRALSIILCYAFGVVAFRSYATPQTTVYTSYDFSTQALWGETPRYGLPDVTGGSYYWFYTGDYGNSAKIRDYDTELGDPAQYNRFRNDGNPRPAYMAAGQENHGLLDFFVDLPLVRTFDPVDESGRSRMVEIPENGLFIDSLVKFVPRNEPLSSVPQDDVGGLAKFMCWLSAPQGSSTTNLIVTAGRIDASGNPYRANYLTTAKVEAGRWYRLTARAIANAATEDGAKTAAFALYLDGEQVVCAPEDYRIGDDPAAMAARFAGNEHFDRCGLFPSIIRGKGRGSVSGLYGVAVQGEGAIDEIGVVQSGNPLLDSPVGSLLVKVVADAAKVASISCTVTAAYSQAPYTNAAGAASVELEVLRGQTIRVYAEAKPGYALLDTPGISGNSNAVQSVSGYAVTLNSDPFVDDAALVIRVNTRDAFYRVGDRSYASFDEAQSAAVADPSRRLTIETDITLDPESDHGQMRILKTNELVIDLNGRRIKGENFLDEAAIYNQGRLTIVDSVGGGVIEASGTAIETISANDALEVNYGVARLTMGDEAVTNEFRVLGRVRVTEGELVLKVGDYLTPPGESVETFYLGAYLAPGRFSSARHDVAGEGTCWRVLFDGRVRVDFRSPVGSVDPAYVIGDYGMTVAEPSLTAPGYAAAGWYAPGEADPFEFGVTQVTNDLTLTVMAEAETFTIRNDYYQSGFPTSYRIDGDYVRLPVPTRRHYAFGGWRDANSGNFVDGVGRGAKFVGSETTVTGDLDLHAVWTATPILWENSGHALVESNGVYAGSWSIAIPEGQGLLKGTKVAIDEIAFGIVNPLLYPKTAAYLAFTNATERLVSAARQYDLDGETGEFLAGAGTLANGRAKVAYRFTGLEVRVGYTNGVYFCDAGGDPASGVLRLTQTSDPDFTAIGPCSGASPAAPNEAYSGFVPVYEITGHLVEEDHE